MDVCITRQRACTASQAGWLMKRRYASRRDRYLPDLFAARVEMLAGSAMLLHAAHPKLTLLVFDRPLD